MAAETDTEGIRKEARMILDRFAKALDKVPETAENIGNEGSGVREEGAGNKQDDDFRNRMFANAPRKDGDCILAEKASWNNNT